MKCEICGKEFEPKTTNGMAKYCSRECKMERERIRAKYYNEKRSEKLKNRDHTKTCPICQNKFQAVRNELYCSDVCKKIAQRKRRSNLIVNKTERPKPKNVKGLDGLMEQFRKEGKTPEDYREWKIEQAKKKVSPINLNI